jgi:hypothetical protein
MSPSRRDSIDGRREDDTTGVRAEAADPVDPSDLRLLPPIFVPLSDEQRRMAVDALAELLVPYVEAAREQPR